MKRNMTITEYNRETGFPIRALRQLARCSRSEEFGFRRMTSGRTSPWYIIVPVFQKAEEAGAFKEVLEQ